MSSIYLTVVNIQQKKRETRKPSSTGCVSFSLCRMVYPHSSTGAKSLWLSTWGTFWLIFKALSICPPLLPTGNNSNRLLHSQPKSTQPFLKKDTFMGEMRAPSSSSQPLPSHFPGRELALTVVSTRFSKLVYFLDHEYEKCCLLRSIEHHLSQKGLHHF